MAERRMFAKTIIDSDAFLDMPISAQALYFHLGTRADDDGFVNSPKKIQRIVNASDDDFKILLSKRFLIPFESGIVVIKHWRIHNYIQNDRYHPTVHREEFSRLSVKENGAYTECIQNGYNLDAQVRLGKVSLELGKDSQDKEAHKAPNNNDTSPPPDDSQPKTPTKRFIKPTLDEVKAYCAERRNTVSPEKFLDYYEANGWKVGRNPMKDWRAAVRTWEKNEAAFAPKTPRDFEKEDAERRKRTLEKVMQEINGHGR
jgi:hypothetical protein